MQHIKFLLSVIIVISGLYVTFYINTVRRKYRFSYLSKLVIYMLIVVVLFSVMMFAIYFRLNLPVDFLFNRSSTTGNIISLASYTLFFFLIYLMFMIVVDMLGIKAKSSYKGVLILFLVMALIIEFFNVFHPVILNSHGVLKFVYEYIVDNFIFLEMILLIFLILKGKKIQDVRREKAIVTFGYLFLLRYVVLLIGYLIFVVSGFSQEMVIVVQLLILLSLIFIPYLWVRIYYLRYVESLVNESDIRPHLDNICRKYGISGREKEIIFLMIRGKTNKEIEEELFISINTVKNHVYNIFKKLKIKSRHQLIKFFTQI